MALNFDSFDDYLDARQRLIDDEQSLRRDHQPLRTISPAERKADERLRALRASEANSLWKAQKDPNGRLAEMYPGMGFLTAKNIIHQSSIFPIMKALPKGALLHAHFDAICDFPVLLNMAVTLGNGLVHVSAPQALNHANIHDVFPEFHILDPDSPPPSLSSDSKSSLTSSAYAGGTWIPLDVARKNFSLSSSSSVEKSNNGIKNRVMFQRLDGLRGPEAFDAWAAACASIDPAEAHETMNTVDEIWRRFQRCFGVTRGLSYFEPCFRAYTRAIFEHCVEEGISYVELRLVFWFEYMARANGKLDFGHSEWLAAFSEVQTEFKRDLAARGESHKFIGARLIYTSLRFCTDESLTWCLNDCIEMKKKYPDLICGFDLVGQEDAGRPLIDFAPQLIAFQQEVERQGLYIPFLFHAGETLGDGTSTDQNLYDAILLGTKRIGHGHVLCTLEMCLSTPIFTH